MQTKTANPQTIFVPIAAGGRGWSSVREFYDRHFVVGAEQARELIDRAVLLNTLVRSVT